MDKPALLYLFARARRRAEKDEVDLAAQNEIVAVLERKGLDPTMAKAIFAKMVAHKEADMRELERLLDELDGSPSISAAS